MALRRRCRKRRRRRRLQLLTAWDTTTGVGRWSWPSRYRLRLTIKHLGCAVQRYYKRRRQRSSYTTSFRRMQRSVFRQVSENDAPCRPRADLLIRRQHHAAESQLSLGARRYSFDTPSSCHVHSWRSSLRHVEPRSRSDRFGQELAMAASRHQCAFSAVRRLVSDLQRQFGGRWLLRLHAGREQSTGDPSSFGGYWVTRFRPAADCHQ